MSIPSRVDVLVVVTTEQIDHHTAPDFREELAGGVRRSEAAPSPSPELIVDLSKVTFLDSTGIRELIDAEQALARHRGAGTVRGRINQRDQTLTRLADQGIPCRAGRLRWGF